MTTTTTPSAGRLRKATPQDLDPLVSALGAAFFTDPVMSWCYPDAGRRRIILPDVFRVITEAALPAGAVYTTDEIVGAAVWFPPDARTDEDRMASNLVEASREYADRMLALLETTDGRHPPQPGHYYLSLLGTEPGWRSRGLGSSLMRPVLDGCDRDGTHAYLEASSERNLPLYLRHGFEVTERVALPDGPPFWCMWREPAAAT